MANYKTFHLIKDRIVYKLIILRFILKISDYETVKFY
jgi:hypothetical protein